MDLSETRYYGSSMTDWPADWRPVNAEEAQRYLQAHKDGAGDPDLLEECQFLIAREQSPPAGISRVNVPRPFPEVPEGLTEEAGAD